MYKYMTWTEGKYFEGNQLLSLEQREILLESFSGRKLEQFVTIQDYDSDGSILGCPLYFDIDAPSLYDAYESMQTLVSGIVDEFNIEPYVFFSGGKGFHVIAPLYIRHPRCHEIVKLIWKDLFPVVDCDPKVYRTRAMFRLNNTWNLKGERYKIQVHKSECLNSMMDKAKEIRPTWIVNGRYNCIDLDVTEYISQLPTFTQKVSSGEINFSDMMPCLKNLWANPEPPEGQRHELAHLFIRHCFNSGLDEADTEAMFATHPFWGTVERRDYKKIITSVYRNGVAMLGCKNNELLQNNCVKFCKYNTNLKLWDIPMRREG